MKTSIKIKKFWYADVAADGGVGTNWKEIQLGLREASVQFNGSDADVTNYKNIMGSVMESAMLKGDMTCNFQLADLTPDVIADFVGGVVTSDANSEKYEAPLNLNQVVEKSIRFLTGNNVLFTFARMTFDGMPMINDDDLHYYQMNSTVLQPTKVTVSAYSFDVLKLPDANDIISFTCAGISGNATINAGAHTVSVNLVNGTSRSAIAPVIGVSLGASILPASGESRDFTTPQVYAVESANGQSQNWTVTMTVL